MKLCKPMQMKGQKLDKLNSAIIKVVRDEVLAEEEDKKKVRKKGETIESKKIFKFWDELLNKRSRWSEHTLRCMSKSRNAPSPQSRPSTPRSRC